MVRIKPPGVQAFETVVVDYVVVPRLPDEAASYYETDEHGWMGDQAAALRAGRWDQVDRVHLAEFLDDMAARDRRELRSRLVVLLVHLLKVTCQPQRLSRSWVPTIRREQREIKSMVDAASLLRIAPEMLAQAWPEARRDAATETGLPLNTFPEDNPWSLAEALAFEPPEPPARSRRR